MSSLRALAPLVRQAVRAEPQFARGLRTSVEARSAPKGYHYDYEHGPNYLNFQDWPGRKWKVGAWIIALVSTGVGIPAFAVWWQQSKLKG